MIKILARFCIVLAFWLCLTKSQLQAEPYQETNIMQQGQSLLQLAQASKNRAREALAQNSQLRQFILEGKALEGKNQLLAEQARLWQQHGSEQRRMAKQLEKQAKQLFALGLNSVWPTRSLDLTPITLAQAPPLLTTAHNTPVRSTHENMPQPASPSTRQQPEMSLLLPTQMNQQAPEGLETGSVSLSRQQVFVGHIEVSQGQDVKLNQIHSWDLYVAHLDGRPATLEQVQFTGHMPGHVHGLPTQPQVEASNTAGIYHVKGVKFQMAGWWVIDFVLSSEHGQDSLRFNLLL